MCPSIASHNILVVGGAGFVGYHLISYFVAHKSFANVAVLSRSAASSSNHVEGVAYYCGDIADHDTVKDILEQVKPSIIIHAATASPVTGTPKDYQHVNIDGTKNLLDVAKDSKSVRAFIFTSSSTLAKGPKHVNVDESFPLADTDPKASAYARSKALAEVMILEANSPFDDASNANGWAGCLTTASLRFPIIYGVRDPITIPGCLNALSKGQTNAILGDGTNLWSFCSAENAAISHVLLAKALLSPQLSVLDLKVDGEAFNINDGSPYPFWEFARLCWKYAGHDPQPPPKVTKLPSWFALGIASLLEWVYWIFTLGTKRPYNLGKQQVEYACFTHTYNISKARRRLKFEPTGDFEDKLKEAVEWSMNEGGWRTRLREGKSFK